MEGTEEGSSCDVVYVNTGTLFCIGTRKSTGGKALVVTAGWNVLRTLLGCVVSNEMIASLNVSKVYRGTVGQQRSDGEVAVRFKSAIDAGIFEEIASPSEFHLDSIIGRINQNHLHFTNKVERKKKSEDAYYDEKYSKTDHYNNKK